MLENIFKVFRITDDDTRREARHSNLECLVAMKTLTCDEVSEKFLAGLDED